MAIQTIATVLLDSFSRGRCKQCRMPVTWYRTVGGAWLPFDGRPRVDRVRYDPPNDPAAARVGDIPRTELHWRSCSARALEAAQTRRR